MSFIAKKLREDRFKLVSDAQDMINAPDAGDEAVELFDRMMAEADKLKEQIDRVERAAAERAQMEEIVGASAEKRGITAGQVHDELNDWQTAMRAMLRVQANGPSALNMADRDALTRMRNAASLTGSAGGYLVPTELYNRIISGIILQGGVLEVATVIRTADAHPINVPYNSDVAVATQIAEGVSVSSGTDLVFSQLSLGGYKFTTNELLVSRELIQDAQFDFLSFLTNCIINRFARGINLALTTGSGSGAPKGVQTAAVALGNVKTGLTGQTTSLIYRDLLDVEHLVAYPYRRNARWLIGDATWKIIKALVDSQGRPLWMPSLTVGAPESLLGYPVSINADASAPGANNYTIIFGDFSNYWVRLAGEMRINTLQELYAKTDQVGVLAFQRLDANLMTSGAALSVYRHSAT